MTKQIEERIKIIKQFKSIYSTNKKEPKENNFWFRMSAGFDYWAVMLLLAFIFILSFVAVFQYEPLSFKWQESGLIVLMTFALAIKPPYSFIELMLLKHVKNLNGLNINFQDSLNDELKEIIDRINSKKHRLNVVGLPAIFIILGALLHQFDLNPYWNYFSYGVLIFSPFILFRIHFQINLVRKSLKKFDSIII